MPPSMPPASALPPPLGVYVHFPWCLSKCPYCDFVVHAAPRESIDHAGYAAAVLAELASRAADVSPGALASIFFGGGTPSLWAPEELGRVLAGVTAAFRTDPSAIEVTVECDPSSLDEDLARALVDVGVGRLSIGVQSFDDERLRFLGRIHTGAEAEDAVRGAVRAGMPRVSTDLIYALAGEAPGTPAREAHKLVELGATHVSAYSLTIEPSTPFGKLAKRGRLPLCEDGAMAASFFAIDEALTGVGLEHYEVSNYAAQGQRSRHNLGYWQGHDYLGLGCGAYGTISSSDGFARRYRNTPSPREYVRRAAGGRDGLAIVEERLDGPTRLRERIMLGLRMKEGFDLESAAHEIGTEPYPEGRRAALAQLETRGRIVRRGSRVSVPRDAWIWVDDTAAALF
jgi:putative oxygen-independent coproporphyrinogen III oxidase